MPSMMDFALAYSRMGWRIFPCHSVRNGQCSCGKPHADGKGVGKHPRIKNGFRGATSDPDQIRRWWTKWPDANIALATGSGIAVFDIDGEQGASEFKALAAAHGPPPQTLVSRTGAGYHLVFATQPGKGEVRSSAMGKVHVRGEGGYIILPPSTHLSGRRYQWVNRAPLAPLPDYLRQWSQGYEISAQTPRRPGLDHLGLLPTHLSQQNQRDVGQKLSQSLKTEWSPAEQARLESALAAIPMTCGYETFLKIGMALKELDWERSDGTSISFDIWNDWCSRSEHHNPAGLEFKWRSFRRQGVTLGTVFHLANQHGWTGLPAIAAPQMNGHDHGLNGHANGATALPAAFAAAQGQGIFFPDRTEEGKAKPTMLNAEVAMRALGIECRKDVFHEKMLVGGHPIQQWAGDLSDEVIQVIRKTIRRTFGFDPKKDSTVDAAVALCLENQFDPVLDYINSLVWDGTPRLDGWLSTYMGAAPTELNRAIARIVLVAAVRRAREPGTKFDEIVVFESHEGKGKSTAIEILAGPENFSDQNILGLSGKEQQEAMAGIWLYEIADLTGMKRAEIEHVKAFASRKVDRARPAYGRFRLDRPRRTIFFATTNDDEYLKSQTGNRRFWPVPVGKIDLASLRRDRAQLWAEAAMREARGESIRLPEKLWGAAGEEQNLRLEGDDWTTPIHNYITLKARDEFTTQEVLQDNQFLQLHASQIGRPEQMRAGHVLKRLGFVRYRKRIAGNAFEWRYRRSDPPPP